MFGQITDGIKWNKGGGQNRARSIPFFSAFQESAHPFGPPVIRPLANKGSFQTRVGLLSGRVLRYYSVL